MIRTHDQLGLVCRHVHHHGQQRAPFIGIDAHSRHVGILPVLVRTEDRAVAQHAHVRRQLVQGHWHKALHISQFQTQVKEACHHHGARLGLGVATLQAADLNLFVRTVGLCIGYGQIVLPQDLACELDHPFIALPFKAAHVMAHKFNVVEPLRQREPKLVHGGPGNHAVHHGRTIRQGLANGLKVKDLGTQARRFLPGRQGDLPVGLTKTIGKLGLSHTHGHRGRVDLTQVLCHRLGQVNAFIDSHHRVPPLGLGTCHLGRIQHQGPIQGTLAQFQTQAHQHASDHRLCKCHGHDPGGLARGSVGQVIIFHLSTLYGCDHQPCGHLHIEARQGGIAHVQLQVCFHDPVILLEGAHHACAHVEARHNIVHSQTQTVLRACVDVEKRLAPGHGACAGIDARKYRAVDLCQTARLLDHQLQCTARTHGEVAAGAQSPHGRDGGHTDLRRQRVYA